MFPDQNQPQNTNPLPDPTQQPMQPSAMQQPGEPAPVAPSFDQPAPLPPVAPVDPAPVAPIAPVPAPVMPADPIMPQAPAPYAPESPITQPLQPMQAPAMAVPPAPTTGVLDSSQVGYVPPAVPVAPSPIMGNASTGKGSKLKTIRIALAVVVGLAVFSGGGLLLKDVLFTGSSISKSELVETTDAEMTFKRPKSWTKADSLGSLSSDFEAAYTEGGSSPDGADQAILLSNVALGTNVSNLSESQKEQIAQGFKDEFTDASKVESEDCKEASGLKADKITQANYDMAFSLEYTCNKINNRAVKAKVKAIYGIKGSNIQILAIVAIDSTWEKSGDVFDEILTTFKPAS